MKFLFVTEPNDTHAALTQVALESIDHEAHLFFPADLPTKQTHSIYLENNRYEWRRADRYQRILDANYDVVWWRRPRKPHLPPHLTHPNDYDFVARENLLFYESITENIAPKARWINPKNNSRRGQSKLLQLKMAAACGLEIPITLCSNSPLDIRYFILKHEDDGVIYKPFFSHAWLDEKPIRAAYTTSVNFLDLPSNALLQLTPGIFQREIRKAYELRVTCFGDNLVAVKLDSQLHKEGKTDWRAIPEDQLKVELYPLPEEVEAKLRWLMHDLGLVFGAIDLIVDTEGNYVFLEVNEQGQFLWIEECNPSIEMLDRFLHFLLYPQQAWSGMGHSIEQYRQAMSERVAENQERHIDVSRANTAPVL